MVYKLHLKEKNDKNSPSKLHPLQTFTSFNPWLSLNFMLKLPIISFKGFKSYVPNSPES